MNNSPTFGEKLRELREAKDMSLRELARKVNVSAAFLSDVELGRRFPAQDTLILIAKEMGVDASELQKFDFRDDSENIRKMMFADPAAGMAFRTVAEKLRSGVSPEEIVKRLKK